MDCPPSIAPDLNTGEPERSKSNSSVRSGRKRHRK